MPQKRTAKTLKCATEVDTQASRAQAHGHTHGRASLQSGRAWPLPLLHNCVVEIHGHTFFEASFFGFLGFPRPPFFLPFIPNAFLSTKI